MECTDIAKEINLNDVKDQVQYQTVNVDMKIVQVREVTRLAMNAECGGCRLL